MNVCALGKIPTQKVDSSQYLEEEILQEQPKIINKMTKSWDKKTIRDLEQKIPEKDHDFLYSLLLSKTILPRILISSWSAI